MWFHPHLNGEVPNVRQPLLLQYYNDLPDRKAGDSSRQAAHRIRRGLNRFKKSVEGRYQEASLERLLVCANPEVRQAAVLALALRLHECQRVLAARLHDEDPIVSELAADSLWSVWFRAETKENNLELQRLMRLRVDEDRAADVLAGFRALIDKARVSPRPTISAPSSVFAWGFREGRRRLRKNAPPQPVPLRRRQWVGPVLHEAEKAARPPCAPYRRANRINPHLDGVKQVIDSLERMLAKRGRSCGDKISAVVLRPFASRSNALARKKTQKGCRNHLARRRLGHAYAATPATPMLKRASPVGSGTAASSPTTV